MSDQKKGNADLEKIREREERGSQGPWKWQLIDLLTRIESKLDRLVQESDTKAKLSAAGKKSAEARRAKYGDAKPSAAVSKNGAELEKQNRGNGTEFSMVIVDDPIPDLLGEPVHEPVRKKAAKKVKAPTDGSQVWVAYKESYLLRHRVEPVRGASANRLCAFLASSVGGAQALHLVRYYLTRNDALYLNAKHPLNLLVRDLQKLNTELLTNRTMTARQAQKEEVHSSIDNAVREYESERTCSEQVRVKEEGTNASRTVE